MRSKEDNRERSAKWRANHPDLSLYRALKYRETHPDVLLQTQLKKYDLDLETYRGWEGLQEGRCAICKELPKGMQNTKSRLCVDHDHKTGLVRGLLCGGCNVALGHFNHSILLLEQAIIYLKESDL